MQASFTPISPHMTRKRGPLNRILQNSGCWTEYIFFVMKTNREDQKDWSGCGVLSFLSSAIHPGNPFFVYLVSISQWYQFPCPATSPIRLWSPCLPIHTQTHTHVHAHVHAHTHTHTQFIYYKICDVCVYVCVCIHAPWRTRMQHTRAHLNTHTKWTWHIRMSHVTHLNETCHTHMRYTSQELKKEHAHEAKHSQSPCVTWLIHICDMTHSYMWHDSRSQA